MKRKKDVLDVLDTSEPITKIFFVRHGQTKANKEKLIIGQWDLPLNDLGKLQAKNAGKIILKSKEKIDLIISSPLKRTKETAKIISKIVKIKKIILDKNIIEKSEGTFEGFSYWEVREKDRENYFKWLKDPFKNRPPKGESVVDLENRIKKFYSLILKNYRGKNIVVVSHSGPIRSFVLNILKANVNKWWHLKVENGSVTEVHISKNHQMIWALNRIS